MFTHPFPLESYLEIKNYMLEYMQQFNQRNIYAEKIVLPSNIKKKFDEELSSYGLPIASNYLAFKRKNYLEPNLETVHLDYFSEIRFSSIVLPIENYKGTSMFWMDGEYSLDIKLLPHGGPYAMVRWKSTPKIIHQKEILEPTLCRVDIPHDALSNIDGSYRTILSIRLNGNLKLDDIIKKRFNLSIE